MDPVTHVATGVLISQMLPGPARGWSALAARSSPCCRTCDYVLIYADRLAFIREHRSFTHSLLGLVLLALLGAAIGRLLGGSRWFRPLLFLGLAVLASHLCLDLATSYGTQILFPFSRRALPWIGSSSLTLTSPPYCFSGLLPPSGRSPGAGSRRRFSGRGPGFMCCCAPLTTPGLGLARRVFAAPLTIRPPAAPGPARSLPCPARLPQPSPRRGPWRPSPNHFPAAAGSSLRWLRGTPAGLRAAALPGLSGDRAG